MRSLIRILHAGALLLLFSHCQKIELPPTVEGSPVFTLQASLDGRPLEIAAGDSSYVLRATFLEDSLGVPVYRGAFQELECTSGCLPSVRFSFRGAGPGSAQPETDLHTGAYPLLQPVGDMVEITYKVLFSGVHEASTLDAPITYRWDFGDGLTSNLQDPEHSYPDDSPRLVRLETRNSNGCASSKEQRVAFEPQPAPCAVDFTIQPSQGASPAQAVMDGPFNIYETWSWFAGDSSLLASYLLPQLTPQDTLQQCLTATTTEGCQAQTCQSVYLNNFQSLEYCATDFTYQAVVDTSFTPASDQWGTVWVEYTDGAGRLFSSASGIQFGSFFEVAAVEGFEPNAEGQPTKKMELLFECRLYTADGQPSGVLSGTGVIAVAHP